MIYFVRNSAGNNIAEIEIYWEEGDFDENFQSRYWELDCQSYFYMKDFLLEFKDRSDCMNDESLKDFINDIDEIQNFRGIVHEKFNINKLIDHK